jgi:WhiB family redox-sensing transcriptional regulator
MFSEPFIPEDYPDFMEFGNAPCSENDPEIFFPVDRIEGKNPQRRAVYLSERSAKITCSGCPYKMRCFEYAIKNEDLLGIWGGTTEQERRQVRKGARVRFRVPLAKHI